MRKMKDSGIEWIGEIPEEWEVTNYRRIFQRRKEYDNKDKQVLSLTIQGVKEKTESYGKMAEDFTGHQIVRKNDLVFTPRDFDATPILSGVAPCDGCISNLYFVLFPYDKSKVYIPFYNYFMWGVKWGGDIWRKLSYGMRFSYNFQQFSMLPTVLPPLEEQSRIANFLDDKCGKIDRYIETQRAIIEKLKAYKQAVITEAVTKGLDPTVPMKDSGVEWIGEIPQGWRVGQLKYFVKIRSGITLGKKYSPETELKEYPYLRVANVQGEYTDLSDVAMISVPEDEAQKYILHTGELLMTEGGDRDKLGRGCVWEGKITPCLHQNHVFAVTANALRLNVYYLDYVTTSDVGRSYFDYTAKKTTNLASTNSTTILQFRLPVPPIEEQQKIVQYLKEKVDELNQMLTKHLALIDKLAEYKKSLIYEAVTGKLEV